MSPEHFVHPVCFTESSGETLEGLTKTSQREILEKTGNGAFVRREDLRRGNLTVVRVKSFEFTLELFTNENQLHRRGILELDPFPGDFTDLGDEFDEIVLMIFESIDLLDNSFNRFHLGAKIASLAEIGD